MSDHPGDAERSTSDVDQELRDRLASLPSPETMAFFDDFGKFLGQRSDCYEPTLRLLIANGNLGDAERLAACWGLLHGDRRRKNRAAFRQDVRLLETHFPHHPLTSLMRAEALADDASSDREHREALELARRANVVLTNASTLMTTIGILLNLIDRDPADKAALIAETERLINDAVESCTQEGREYPKLFAFQARLQREQGLYSTALRSIERAIEAEDSTRKDYPIRIGDYQATRLSIVFASELDQLRAEQGSVLAELRDARGDLLSLLGLLAAVIALLVTTAQSAQKLAIRDASRFSLVTGGSILLIFTGYQFLFTGKTRTLGIAAALLLGLAMVLLPLFYWPSVR